MIIFWIACLDLLEINILSENWKKSKEIQTLSQIVTIKHASTLLQKKHTSWLKFDN